MRVVCKDNINEYGSEFFLTLGKAYLCTNTEKKYSKWHNDEINDYYRIINDQGLEGYYLKTFFYTECEYRKIKLTKLNSNV